MSSDISELQRLVCAFRDERDWKQFHNPKNLACSISIEAAELLEHFQWLTPEESLSAGQKNRRAIGLEMADIAMYLLLLADQLDLDLAGVIREKLQDNRERYPVEKAKGSAAKYDKL